MYYKSSSIINQPRFPASLVALLVASLTLFASGARAWNCITSDQWGTCSDGPWTITQDVWGGATNWQQSLYCNSHSNWQIVANLKGQAWVGSYPHANYPVGQPLNNVLNGPSPLLAAWNATYPTDHKFDFAYDLWLNGTTYEVMIWLNWKNTAPIGGNPFTNATIGGITYNVYEGAGGSGPHCISFLPQSGMMDSATNFNLCKILSWISNLPWNGGPGGYYWQNPSFDSVQLGWEICDTYGSLKTYTMNYFDVYYGNSVSAPPRPAGAASAPAAPTVEQLIWQANFDSSFPNAGGYGFTFRDGSPAATSGLSTNLTGGVGGSASLEYTVNLSTWGISPPTSYSGFGVGATEAPLPHTLAFSNKASYRVYVSAKVGGAGADVTSVPANVDLNFFTSAGQQVFDLTAPLVLSTNWQSYVLDGGTNLQVATWLTGAQQLLNQNLTNVNKMELQITIPGSPNVGTLFGYANGKTIDIDNLMVVELVPRLARLRATQSNRQSQVFWANPKVGGTAQLQNPTNAAGAIF
jgi:hypothetical protein